MLFSIFLSKCTFLHLTYKLRAQYNRKEEKESVNWKKTDTFITKDMFKRKKYTQLKYPTPPENQLGHAQTQGRRRWQVCASHPMLDEEGAITLSRKQHLRKETYNQKVLKVL